MQYRKPRPWDWHPDKVLPKWRNIAKGLAAGYPMWGYNNDIIHDIGPERPYPSGTTFSTGGFTEDEYGPSWESDGNDYIDTGRQEFRKTRLFADSSDKFTIICRARFTNSSSTIFAVAGAATSNRQLQLFTFNSGTPTLGLYVRGNYGTIVSADHSDNRYRTYVVVWTGAQSRVYVMEDGVFAVGNDGSAARETSQNLTLFARTNGAGYPATGHMDYCYVFDRQLYQHEIEEVAREPYGLLVRHHPLTPLRAPVGSGTDETVVLTGIEATGAVGAETVTIDQTIVANSIEAPGEIGQETVPVSETISVNSLEAPGQVGDESLVITVDVSPTGIDATGYVGTEVVSIPETVVANSLEAVGEIGIESVFPECVVSASSIEAPSEIGSLDFVTQQILELVGLSSTGEIGSVILDQAIIVALTGIEAVGEIGTESVSLGAGISLTGIEASGEINSIAGFILDQILSPAGIQASGDITTPLVWGLIDDSQVNSWSEISDTQTPGWSELDDSQTPNWNEID